jgi:hypothetical protein
MDVTHYIQKVKDAPTTTAASPLAVNIAVLQYPNPCQFCAGLLVPVDGYFASTQVDPIFHEFFFEA